VPGSLLFFIKVEEVEELEALNLQPGSSLEAVSKVIFYPQAPQGGCATF
jgi:hypothetical protein